VRPEEVDAVYLWVDGASASFRNALAASVARVPHSDGTSLSTSRFRDNGELRYSLRSLECFAPWVRRVHIVTNGQVPAWLDLSNPKVGIVEHEAIFPSRDDLPTFNSNAIELQLHRIPGLSRRFLYLNDDVFLGAPTTRETFLGPDGRQQVFLQETPLHDQTDSGPVHDRSYAHTQKVIDGIWGRQGKRLLPAHTPQLYDKDLIAEIERRVPGEFANTASHRVRSADDLVLRILYLYRVIESRPEVPAIVLKERSRDYCFARLEGSCVADTAQLLRIARLRPRFFCINDDMGDSLRERVLLKGLTPFLRFMFPTRSPYEAA